jgi:hypothetical protein
MLRHTKTLTYHLFHLTTSTFPWFVILLQVFIWFSAWDYCLFMLIFMACRILSAHTILTMRMVMTNVSVVVIMLFWIGTVIDHWFINCNTLCRSWHARWFWQAAEMNLDIRKQKKRLKKLLHKVKLSFTNRSDQNNTHICYIFLAACFILCYSFSKPCSYATIFLVENKLGH